MLFCHVLAVRTFVLIQNCGLFTYVTVYGYKSFHTSSLDMPVAFCGIQVVHRQLDNTDARIFCLRTTFPCLSQN